MMRLNRPLSILVQVLILAATPFALTAAQAEAPFSFAATPGKLPKDVVPIDYTVHVVPDIVNFTLSGQETINIQVLKTTSKLMMNALNIEVDAAMLAGKGIASQTLTPMIDKDQQTLSFTLAAPLKPGQYALSLSYRGLINRGPKGLYYDKYPTASGQKVLLGTQMEAADARRMLPSWDEPVFRAKFTLSVDLPANFKAYSNTPIRKQEMLASGLQRTTFGTTPKMASYLIVLVAGELERLVGSQDGVEIGIVTTEGKQDAAAYALASSKDLLHYYNDYFDVPFPLPKLDQIATPGGYGGAMENWGGIVYNEATLLYDPKKSPDATRQRSFGIAAHEMAHQWFGDLVTMAWWDNLWLNEGFASWMATKATAKFNPDWNVWLRANGARETAMNLDARRTSHPIQRDIANESQATDAFDAITYQKGQSFLRMLETYLGEDTFRNGIRAYMAKHKYSNTTTADLWTALANASGKPVADIASMWITQPGFPVVKIDARCEMTKGAKGVGMRKITLTQEQFKIDGDEPGERLWNIPVQLGTVNAAADTSAAGKADYVLLKTRSTTVTRPGCAETLLVDPLSVGYYRVQYAPALFDALSAQLPKLADTARLKVLSDTWAMVAGNRLPVASYLNLIAKLGNEPRLAIWDKMLDDLNSLDRLSAGETVRPQLRKFAIGLLQPKLKELGWDERGGDTIETRQLRSRILRTLGEFGDEAVIVEARARFQRLLADPASLPPSLADVVPRIAGRYADQATYDALGQLAAKAISSEEKFRYFAAMNSAADPKLAAQSLPLSLSTTLPPLVTTRVLAEVAGSEHVDMAWVFAKQNGAALLNSINGFERNRYFAAIVRSANEVAIADDLEAWVKANLPPDALREAQRTAEAIRTRAELKARVLPQLAGALKQG